MIRKIAEDISKELLSKNTRQIRLQGNRLDNLIMSVENLIRDSVSIRFSRSRMNLASIKSALLNTPKAVTTSAFHTVSMYSLPMRECAGWDTWKR